MDRISAFMDGEANSAESTHTMLSLKKSEECRETWQTFHLIGDVMRGESALREDFATRLHARMEDEPLFLAPRLRWRKSARFALSAAASLAAVAVVVSLVLTDNPLQPQPQLAVAPKSETSEPVQVLASPRPAPAANSSGVNEYLMAHQEFSPSTALQGVAPYVRTVSATRDGSGH